MTKDGSIDVQVNQVCNNKIQSPSAAYGFGIRTLAFYDDGTGDEKIEEQNDGRIDLVLMGKA